MEKYMDLWNKVLDQAENEYETQVFTELFSDCIYNSFKNGYIYILAPNEFAKSRIMKLYIKKIDQFLENVCDENIKIKFVTEADIKKEEPVVVKSTSKSTYSNNLSQNLTFDNFVVGESNNFAFRMAMKIADQPGGFIANPFYIFGSVGLGKTHLMHAVGNYILDVDLTKNILYIKADRFIEDYSKFCKGEFKEYEEKYRTLDVLLIDDIQVLEIGKKSQLEFFKFFDILCSEQKQIIITSDRPAHELKLMERLTSRFTAGLTVDIKTPNLEHRKSILKRKTQELSVEDIDDEVLHYIASNFTSNIRELEGAFVRVKHYCEAFNSPITLEITKEALTGLINNQKINEQHNEKNFVKVQDIVADFYNLTVADLISPKRQANIVLARHIAMYILKTNYGLSYKKIGSLFSGRDHSTVISGCERIENELKLSGDLQMAVSTIMKKL